MTVTCELCHKVFEPNAGQAALIDRSKAKDMEQVMIECPHCWSHTMVRFKTTAPEEPHLRCPVAGCAGFVVHLKDPDTGSSHWACGECGSGWTQLSSLQREIDCIIKVYPYRSACYSRNGDQWLAAPSDQAPDDYDELVEQETPDSSESFDRD